MELPTSPISATQEESSDEVVSLRRSTRLRTSNPKYANNLYATCQFAFSISGPLDYKEAAEKEEWDKSIVEEMESIEKN